MLEKFRLLLESNDCVVRASGIELVLDILSRVKIVDLTEEEVSTFVGLVSEVIS